MPIPATNLVMFDSFSPHWLNFERKRFAAAAHACWFLNKSGKRDSICLFCTRLSLFKPEKNDNNVLASKFGSMYSIRAD